MTTAKELNNILKQLKEKRQRAIENRSRRLKIKEYQGELVTYYVPFVAEPGLVKETLTPIQSVYISHDNNGKPTHKIVFLGQDAIDYFLENFDETTSMIKLPPLDRLTFRMGKPYGDREPLPEAWLE